MYAILLLELFGKLEYKIISIKHKVEKWLKLENFFV